MYKTAVAEPPKSRFHISQGPLPKKIDPQQPPGKRKPFSTILKQDFSHSAQVILPQELHDLVWEDVQKRIHTLEYSQVIMPLSALLEGEFFNTYIKTGNILMLSEGRAAIDSLYSLKNGQLRLEVPKDVYERAGLVGQPIRGAGRKHMKTRYAVELDLRLPSMVLGKKGFERIVWAFKNVLNSAVTWLFYDFNARRESSAADKAASPLSRHHPIDKTCNPHYISTAPLSLPDSLATNSTPWPPSDLEDQAIEISEWLSLISLQSPRVFQDDDIDPYLCRYRKPDGDPANSGRLVLLQWSGFIPAHWLRQLFIVLVEQCVQRGHPMASWFALSCQTFPTEVVDCHDGYTILGLPRGEGTTERQADLPQTGSASRPNHRESDYILWEYAH